MKFSKWIVLAALMLSHSAEATILWAGGEDVDFTSATVCSVGGNRSSYSRASIHACNYNSSTLPVSNPFPGGAITSGWLTARIWGGDSPGAKYVGLTKSGTTSSLWFGTSASQNTKMALWKWDGTTWTEIAAESTATLLYDGTEKWDMQIINYGASATVNVYLNGAATPRISYTGNVLAGSATSLDSVILRGSGNWSAVSEIIVSDSDTRKYSLATLAPNAAGDTTQWSGTYANINPTTANDAVNISDATSGDVFQCNVTNLPTGTFQILGVKVAARMTQTGSGITSAALGVKTNATVSAPAAVTQAVTWGTTETFYTTNPVTAGPWTSTEINALQIHLQSAP